MDLDSTWGKARAGDRSARDALVLHYQPLVRIVARKVLAILREDQVDLDDLTQCGNLGLLKAIEAFEPTAGRFETYAFWKIRGAILDEIRQYDWLPEKARRRIRALHEAELELAHELRRGPTDEELAARLGVKVAAVHRARSSQNAGQPLERLDRPLASGADGGDPHSSFGSMIADASQDVFEDVEIRTLAWKLTDALSALDPREQQVFDLYYVQRLSFRDIATTMGIAVGTVSNLQTRALQEIAKSLK